MKFACRMGFSDMANRMSPPPSLSCDRKRPPVTICMQSWVVGLILEGNLVKTALEVVHTTGKLYEELRIKNSFP